MQLLCRRNFQPSEKSLAADDGVVKGMSSRSGTSGVKCHHIVAQGHGPTASLPCASAFSLQGVPTPERLGP